METELDISFRGIELFLDNQDTIYTTLLIPIILGKMIIYLKMLNFKFIVINDPDSNVNNYLLHRYSLTVPVMIFYLNQRKMAY